MERYRAYSEYKDAGLDWIDEIPAGWATRRICFLFTRKADKGHPEAELLSVYRDYGVVPKNSRGDNWNKPSDDLSNYQLVKVGDLVLNKMKAWQGSVAISEYEGIVSPAYFVAEQRRDDFAKQADCRFVNYLLRSSGYISQYLRYSKGIRPNQWDLDFDAFKTIMGILPPLDEQKTIASFLDRETAKIDQLIAKQEELIALLKEKRQAVISQAVTKGLDPNVPMKDSGVEWLGEIPAHWNFGPLKRFANVIDCKHHTVEFLDEGFPVVSIREIRDDRIDLSDAKQTSREEWNFLREGRIPKYGDMILCRNASVGVVGYVDFEEPFCMGQDVCLIRPSKTSRYMHYQLTSPTTRCQIESFLIGATIRRLNVEEIRCLIVACPPKAEQDAISKFLACKLAKLDGLTAKAQHGIALLQERRSALISAAVTGKIDLRS